MGVTIGRNEATEVHLLMRKGDTNLRYEVHGVGLDSIRDGFRELTMPDHRRGEAFRIVAEILDVNNVVDFRWYKPPGTDELSCYWDGLEANALWITASDVHVVNDIGRVVRPARPTTWQKKGGAYVGWLLPGAEPGAGGGKRKGDVARVMCPVSFIYVPAGSICSDCEVVHAE